jgi:hypothetical protein
VPTTGALTDSHAGAPGAAATAPAAMGGGDDEVLVAKPPHATVETRRTIASFKVVLAEIVDGHVIVETLTRADESRESEPASERRRRSLRRSLPRTVS